MALKFQNKWVGNWLKQAFTGQKWQHLYIKDTITGYGWCQPVTPGTQEAKGGGCTFEVSLVTSAIKF